MTDPKALSLGAEESSFLRHAWQRWILTILFWTGVGLIFSSQYYLLADDASWNRAMLHVMPGWYLWGLLTPLVVWISRRLPRTWSLPKRLLFHIPMGLLWTFVYTALLYKYWEMIGEWLEPLPDFLIQNVYREFIFYGLIIGVHISWDYAAESRQRVLQAARLETRTVQLERNLTEARLRTLQSQLNPHFLFNALNTISAYAEKKPRLVRQMMAELGDLLRASLDHVNHQEVPLAAELSFLESYLSIERLRFKERLTIEVTANKDVQDALVPSFILQPLVENAIQHGAGSLMRKGSIQVSVQQKEEWLTICVQDDGMGLPEGWHIESHGGVGLTNTIRRLDELYGPDHQFHIEGASGRGVRIDIAIPYRERTKEELKPSDEGSL